MTTMDKTTEHAVDAMLDFHNDVRRLHNNVRRLVTQPGASAAEVQQIKRDFLAMAEEVSRG
jgi:hypothetical protein